MIEAGEIPRIEAALDVLLGELVAIDMTPRAPAPKDGLVDDRVRTAILRRDHTLAVSKKDGQLTRSHGAWIAAGSGSRLRLLIHSILGGDPCHSITVAKSRPLSEAMLAPFSFLWN